MAPLPFLLYAALAVEPAASDTPMRVPLQYQGPDVEAPAVALHSGEIEADYKRPLLGKLSMGVGASLLGLSYSASVLVAFGGLYGMVQVSFQGWGAPPVRLAPMLPFAIPIIGPMIGAVWIALQPGHPLIGGLPYAIGDAVAQTLGLVLALWGRSLPAKLVQHLCLVPTAGAGASGLTLSARF